ncbi:MAG: DNA repair protein [Dechloromonas sp.]|nr:DNA repair protein [Dechloromonas sp.]
MTTVSRTPRKQVAATSSFGAIPFLDDKSRKAVEKAVRMIEKSAVYRLEAMNSPGAVRTYLMLKLARLEHEEFHAIWLDAQNRIIAFDALFRGTLTATSVYPRELVKAGLAHNAAAVLFAHNHPSGVASPSIADERLTGTLKEVLALVDIKVLDHFIVAGNAAPLSFAERGLI